MKKQNKTINIKETIVDYELKNYQNKKQIAKEYIECYRERIKYYNSMINKIIRQNKMIVIPQKHDGETKK